MTRTTAYAALVSLLLALLGSQAAATTIIRPTDEQLVDTTPLVVEGRVIASVPVDRAGAIWTETLIAVDRALKGSAEGTIVVREIGGILGDRASIVYGSPVYEAGETVLVFLSPAADGTYRTRDLAVGKFDERTRNGRRVWHRDEELPGTRIIGSSGEAPLRDAGAFEEFIEAKARGRAVDPEYFVSDSTGNDSPQSISSDFTLISEPSIYRWKLFDAGSSISWRSNGTQAGYSNGGLNEMQSALNAWTSYSGANIRMKYDGTTPTAGGISNPNGVHEVIFGDPLSEIEGSWNGSSGVVGRGGFNAAKKGGAWTSPFAADPSHPQKTWDTWEILEGNLVIQDGVSPTKGISAARLAEIIAHELGHTLGIGHSGDGTALMYSSVTGGGAVLRADDQVAARWLYPAPGSAPAPAPSPSPSPSPAPAPSASFSFSPSNPSTQTTVSFSDLSSGSPTAWAWTFGDGTSSSQRNPSKLYSTAGTYTVRLTASNASGSSQTTRTVVVSPVLPSYPAVSAAFEITPATGVAGQQVTFRDMSGGSPTSWSWSFGDGGTSTQRNPVHIFQNPGTYQVRLTASNGGNSGSTVRTLHVTTDNSVARALIAASAEAPGVGGSEWRTELALFNDGASGLTIDFTYIPGAGGAILSRRAYLGAGRSVTYASALRDLFGLVTATGAIAIDARADWGPASLKISSRTFTTGQAGTYGQFVPGENRDAGATTLYLTGVESSSAFRTNIGIVNTSSSWRGVRLTLFDANGQTLAVRDETVAPSSFQQQPAPSFFPVLAGQNRDGMSLRVTADGSGIRAYASIVDNLSHDPIFVPAAAPVSDAQLVVPAIGRTGGAAGTYWRSDAMLFNPHASTMSVALRFLAAGSDNRWVSPRSFTIAPGRTVVIRDLLAWFGLASGTGALRIDWSGTPAAPIVTTRTYTTRGDGGTLGQSMDPVPASAFASRAAVVGSKADAGFRTNIGLVNGDDAPATVWVTVTSAAGATLGRAPLTLPARSQAQTSLASLFPHLTGTVGDFVVRAEGAPKIFLYTSVVDNVSGDPLYIAGE